MEIKELLQQAEERMNKSIEALKHEFASIRTGRASVALLDKVMVDYYGSPSPINQVANISVPEPRMIVIAPWDKTMIGAIEKAIKGCPNHYLKRNMGSLQTRLCKLPWHSNKAIRI